MSIESMNSDRPSLVTWGAALAASSLLLVGGGALIWENREPAPLPDMVLGTRPMLSEDQRVYHPLSLPPELDSLPLHTVVYALENGTRVIKIRVVADGDELIVDAGTGRLLETRPALPTAPSPPGKGPVPVVSAT